MEVQNLILIIIGGLIGIVILGGLLKMVTLGLKKFIEMTFQYSVALLIIGAIGFIIYTVANRDEVQTKFDTVLFKGFETEKKDKIISNNPFDRPRNVQVDSDVYIPTRK